MFLRKLVVIIVPLLLCAALCLMLPAIGRQDLFAWILCGGTIGLFLSLLLPLSGAVRQREPFGGLLWIPSLLLVAVMVYQYLRQIGAVCIPVLDILYSGDTQLQAFLVESAFSVFGISTCIRTAR